jgi:hypothetical protein
MADVFISYARADRARVESVNVALKALDLDVWIDARLTPGERFADEVAREVHAAKAVVVCWTPAAVDSDWVREEAAIGRERKVLAPVMLETCKPPFGFQQLQTADLRGWEGDPLDPAWLTVVGRLQELTKEPQLARAAQAEAEGVSAALAGLLRRLLIAQAAGSGAPMDYKEAEALVRQAALREGVPLGEAFDQPKLWAALNEVAAENRRRGEPPLPVLVINRATGRPGRGYFRKHAFLTNEYDPLAMDVFERHLERVRGYAWPGA